MSVRVAFYSHDTLGLGHIRRNLLIAQSLAQTPICATTLMISGLSLAALLPLAPGVDCVTLPAIQKTDDGEYRPRRWNVALRHLIEIRARIIRGALGAFRPDVLIVDTEPRGAFRELEGTLRSLRSRGTRLVLGMRDIRDHPDVARREWQTSAIDAAIRDYYDEVWVYGDRAVFDVACEYALAADIAARLRYTGYLDQTRRLDLVQPGDDGPQLLARLPEGRMILCTLGGGQDGATVARAFVDAELPPSAFGVLLAGPQMPDDVFEGVRHRAEDRNGQMRVLRFVSEPAPLLARASRIVGMGGYNSLLEALSFETPALIVPRVRPRLEQWIRAERLRALGLVDVVHPDRVSSTAVSEWLHRDVASPAAHAVVDLDGLSRVAQFVHNPQVLAARAS